LIISPKATYDIILFRRDLVSEKRGLLDYPSSSWGEEKERAELDDEEDPFQEEVST
jgi:hypothetical protein